MGKRLASAFVVVLVGVVAVLPGVAAAATAPTVTTSAPTAVTRSSMTLNGFGNPNGATTGAWFRYATTNPGTCNDAFGTRAPAGVATKPLGAGTTNVSFSQAVTGLSPSTTYYVCAIDSNSVGKRLGSVVSVVTPAAPAATTTTASSIGRTTASLNGTGTPNRATTTGWFRYDTAKPVTCNDTFGTRAPAASGGSALGAGTSAQAYTQAITGLAPVTTYWYCAVVSSAEGKAFGGLVSFRTADAPTVAGVTVASLLPTSATLQGTATPNGLSSTGWFRYATTSPGTCNDTFGARAPATGGTALGSGTAGSGFSQPLTNLTPGATYFTCALASNSAGVGLGAVRSFTMPPTDPTVVTSATTLLAKTSATLNGSANPGGDAATGWFRYSTSSPGTCNDAFGTRVPTTGGTALGSGATYVAFSRAVTGLQPLTTYYVCAIASTGVGKALGSVVPFVTPGAPSVTALTATGITGSTATLNGTGNPNRAATTGWFRWSTTNPGTCADTDAVGTRAPATGGSALGAGTSGTAFSQPLTGLGQGTTYYYCAIASSTQGTALSTVLSFTTATRPQVTTNAATSITSTSAILQATGNAGGLATTGWFRYSTADPGTCSDAFGARAPTTSGSNLGTGTTGTNFSRGIAGLAPGTRYFACALAGNSLGVALGNVVTFTTPATPPTVTTSAATGLTSTSATLTGSANPGGDATTAWFRYAITSPGTCNDSFGTRAPTTGGSALGAGTTGVSFSQPATGLAPLTTYYYCALAQNSGGRIVGAVQSFVTPGAPTATTGAASSITATGAILNGSGTANRASTTGWFRWSATDPGTCADTDAAGTRTPASGGSALGSDVVDVPFSQAISGLARGTRYWYCAITSSSQGTVVGAVRSFVTLDAPAVTTGVVGSVTATSASLAGTATPNGLATTGWFRSSATNPGSCTASFGTRTPATGGAALGSGTDPVPFGEALSGLLPGTTYYVCAVAQNGLGTSLGALMTFTTPAAPPTVLTGGATAVKGTTATLVGSAKAGGAAAIGWFRYSTTDPGTCSDTFGTRAPTTGGTSLGSGNTTVGFTQAVTGLTRGTTYYVCALASNAVGLSSGSPTPLTTAAAPTMGAPFATSVTATSAVLNGSANPNRSAATGWFRYSTTNPVSCTDAVGTRAPAAGGTSLGSDIFEQAYQQPISGLTPATTYYVCALASNSEGTSAGPVLAFTTAGPPSAITTGATGVTGDGATLTGSGNPNGLAATGWFRLSTTDPGTCDDTVGVRLPAVGGSPLGTGTVGVPFVVSASGLLPGTTYFACAVVGNSSGVATGGVVTFTTPATAPAVQTLAATDLTPTTATLQAIGNPDGDATGGWFRYSTSSPGTCNDSFGVRAPTAAGIPLGSGSAGVPFAQPVTDLVPATTYYACALAGNGVGVTTGAVASFTTPALPGVPATVVAQDATDLTATTATLHAVGNPSGAPATGWFRYSPSSPGACNDVFGVRAPAGGVDLGSGTTDVPFAQAITGLAPATTYYYCAFAANSAGTVWGSVRSFTTAP